MKKTADFCYVCGAEINLLFPHSYNREKERYSHRECKETPTKETVKND
jgi:hypothetical protein